ncbi:MAG: hypothetical protein IGS50_20475 [Synechococcales cyanobacterium C42_A2020_086]|jgi:hypothetical protein|nr:hypothetical protein [Synechococcales cyanobacterium C42_A2020_086]
MFKVVTRNYSQSFERWTDALEAANALRPRCNWLQDIRIFDGDDLVWIYSRLHLYPQYIGAGTYNRLARLFIFEAMLEQELAEAESGTEAASDSPEPQQRSPE